MVLSRSVRALLTLEIDLTDASRLDVMVFAWVRRVANWGFVASSCKSMKSKKVFRRESYLSRRLLTASFPPCL